MDSSQISFFTSKRGVTHSSPTMAFHWLLQILTKLHCMTCKKLCNGLYNLREEVIGHNQQPHELRWHLLTCKLRQGSSKALVRWQNSIICHFIDRMRFILTLLMKMFIALVAVQHSSGYELCCWKPFAVGHTTEIHVAAGRLWLLGFSGEAKSYSLKVGTF